MDLDVCVAARPRRWLLLPVGALLGAAAAFLSPGTSGCVYHDTCIKVTSPGHDWCRNVAIARQWPIGGSFDDAVLILRPDGAPPRGCRCYNDAENETLELHVPECRYLAFVDELEQAARQACESLVMPGYDHNCWTMSGPQASFVEDTFFDKAGSCIGNCEYGPPPSGGSCPAPNPYECATGDDSGGGDEGCDSGSVETGEGESGLDETGSDTSGGEMLDIEGLIVCDEHWCEIDEGLARELYADPATLLDQGARLVYHDETRRHVVRGVASGSVAFALGLRDGDWLESVDGMVIHDFESALQAYLRLRDADALEVRVRRGSQWLDFTYTFVP